MSCIYTLEGILRVSAVEIDMEPKLLPDIYSDTDAQNPKQSRLSVAFWDACISVRIQLRINAYIDTVCMCACVCGLYI